MNNSGTFFIKFLCPCHSSFQLVLTVYTNLFGHLGKEIKRMLIATFLLSFRPTLKHQRPQEDKQKQFSSINQWYKKGTNLVSKELGIHKNLFPLDSSVMEIPRAYLIDHISSKNTWNNFLAFIAC